MLYNKTMQLSRVVEYVFFFGLLLLSGYMVWQIAAPFVSAIALAAIIVVICEPLHQRIKHVTPRQNKTVAALLTTLIVLFAIVIPLVLMSSLVVHELFGFYQELNTDEMSAQNSINLVEAKIQSFVPFQINLMEQIQASAGWVTSNIGAIFASTVSTIFVFVIALIGSFYFFRDGREFMQLIIKASPLPDSEDQVIFDRMAKAVRAVATGTILIALIQGTLVAVGLTLAGVPRGILWGSLSSVGALMPGIGTSIVTVPAVIYLFSVGNTVSAIGLTVWAVLIVGLVDNFLGPYLISRNNNMHPFIILISVLGGIGLFGPIGFIVGPVVVTLFIVLLEIYNQYIVKEQSIIDLP
jgi:predicted PurR-regulated permease PerM